MKKLFVFDLDGTLAESKLPIDDEMACLLAKLMEKKSVVVTGGGSFAQFRKQLLANLKCKEFFGNLMLMPTNGAFLFRYKDNKWRMKYAHILTKRQKRKIKEAFEKVFKEIGYKNPDKIYGPILDNRDSQITFSALGQKAPIKEREEWRKNCDRREEIKTALEKYLPRFDVVIAGVTSIDVVKRGINKGKAIDYLQYLTKIPDDEVVFVGDSLFKGGNDYLVKKAKVHTIRVNGPEDTKKLIKSWVE